MYCYKIMDMIYILHFIQRGAFVTFQTFKFTGGHSGYLPELGTQMSDTRILELCGYFADRQLVVNESFFDAFYLLSNILFLYADTVFFGKKFT